MAALCPKGHSLRQSSVPSEWRCDACQNHFPAHSVGHGCRQCDVDACSGCVARRCRNNHLLIHGTYGANWCCDGCGRAGTGPTCGCRTCDFDLCLHCAQLAIAQQQQPPLQHAPPQTPHQPTVAPSAPQPFVDLKCQKGHMLTPQAYQSLWACDSCAGRFPATAPGFGCRTCDVDICGTCSKSGGCRSGHILLNQNVPGDWNCDRCGKGHTINEQSRGCRVCDFDICQKCFRDAAVVPTQPHPAPAPASASQHHQSQQQQTVNHPPPPMAAPTPGAPPVPTAPGGKCRAVFIGINYPGTSAELSGCINDVVTMQNLVRAHHFPLDASNCRVLVDDAPKYRGTIPVTDRPTKRNILAALKWLSTDARSGDTLFLHYSGHGTQMRDQDGDEADGYDEALVPADYNHMGCIRDDDVFAIVCRDLPRGVRVTCVADCCHAGSIMDLQYEWRWRGETFVAVPPRKGRKPAVRSRDFKVVSKKATEAAVLLFSGCKDEQTSSDVSNVSSFAHKYSGPGKAGGACTNAMAEVLAGGPSASAGYGKVLQLMQQNLKRRSFSQVPQLSSSQEVDMRRPFSLFGELK